jgi:beta-lactamase class A
MARATINQGANEAAVVAAVDLMVKSGHLNAINSVPAASQLEAKLRYEDRRDAGEPRWWNDAVKTPPLPSGGE